MKTKPTLTLPPTRAARYERRNAKRRKVHLACTVGIEGNIHAACGAHGGRPLPLTSNRDGITCETCRVLLAKGDL